MTGTGLGLFICKQIVLRHNAEQIFFFLQLHNNSMMIP